MECLDTIADYALRSVGIGERLLPRSDYTLCQQFTLIGSGMIWNIYFGVLALLAGFFLATTVALGKASNNRVLRKLSEWFIFLFRGSPLFIQFFFAYFLFLSLKTNYAFFDPFTAAWLGALIVLFLNTSAYTGEIFYGALQSIPKGDTEAADAYGLSGWSRFRRVVWPTMLRLASRRSSCFTPPRWSIFRVFPRGSKRATRCITRSSLQTKRSTPLCPILFWRFTSLS